MNAIVKSPLEDFVDAVLPADRLEDLRRSLPSHIRAEMFQRNLLNAVMDNTDLMQMDTGEVFREVSKAAALGLYLDKQLGEAYIIAGYDSRAKRKTPQLRVGYRGLVKLARQSGEVSQIYAHEVCELDGFDCEMGTHKTLTHKPKVFGERGKIIGYYAVVKYRDGTDDFEPMSIADVLAIRDRSDGYKAFKDGKIKATPWSTDEVEMSKKTVLRRLTKRIPQSPELAEAIKIEDRAEFPNFLEDRPAPPSRRVAPPPPVQQIEHQATSEQPPQQPAPRRAPPPPAQASQPKPQIDIGELQARFADALAFADSEDTANDAYTAIVGPVEADLPREEVEALLQMLRNKIAEIEP